ncbi:MAG: phasin family protein [Alphaproteobacteria bacterium]
MTATKTPIETDLFAKFAESLALPETLARQTHDMLKSHTEMLNGIEEIAHGWFQLRRDANESAIRAAERMFSSSDVSEMLVAYCDWLGGAIRRFTDSATELNEKALAVTASASKAGTNGASAANSEAQPVKPMSNPNANAAQKVEPKPAVQAAPKPISIARPTEQKRRVAG